MRSKLFTRTVLGALLMVSSAQAAPPRSVDARTLDIAGVRTGMDYDQVVAALAQHFQASPGDIKPYTMGENDVTHTKLPAFVVFEKDGTKVAVHFEGRVPVDPAHPLVAWLITYQVPWTPQNIAQMAQAAVAKYGTPSNAPLKPTMQWCGHPGSSPPRLLYR